MGNCSKMEESENRGLATLTQRTRIGPHRDEVRRHACARSRQTTSPTEARTVQRFQLTRINKELRDQSNVFLGLANPTPPHTFAKKHPNGGPAGVPRTKSWRPSFAMPASSKQASRIFSLPTPSRSTEPRTCKPQSDWQITAGGGQVYPECYYCGCDY